MPTRRKYYVLRIDSWEGSDTRREQYSSPESATEIYAVVSIAGGRAVIVDDGYRNRAEAKKAWPEAL